MPELKRRHAAAPAAATGAGRQRKPLSTSKYRDRSSGLSYNYEDRLSRMRLLKTTVLMVILTATVAYFAYNFYLWGSNVVFDVYWHHFRGVRSQERSDFLRQLWIGNFLDLFAIIVKLIVAYWIFRYINSKLLLTFDDADELNKYN